MSCSSYPVFVPLNEVPNEMLPACFLLKLQPAMPVTLPFVKQLSQITGRGKFSSLLYEMCMKTNAGSLQPCCSSSDYFLDVTVPDVDLQWAPLPKLLMTGSVSTNDQWETSCDNKRTFTMV